MDTQWRGWPPHLPSARRADRGEGEGGPPKADRQVGGWLVVGLLWTTTLYALAEELSLTTYYPSPKGAYQTLSSTDSSRFATYAGNVGIGTISPAATTKLEVKGAGNTSGSAGLHVTNSDGTSGLFVRDDGHVGIGTTSPSSLLAISDVNPALTISATNAGGSQKLVLTDADTPPNLYSIGRDNASGFLDFNGTQTGYSGYKWRVNSGTEVMRITNGGNVGIGTPDPPNPLSVEGSIRIGSNANSTPSEQLFVGQTAHTPNPPVPGYPGWTTWAVVTPGIAMWEGGNTGFLARFAYVGCSGNASCYTGTGNGYEPKAISFDWTAINFKVAPMGTAGQPITWTDAMTITKNGNVSIGTLAGTYTNGSAYVCVNNAGVLYVVDTTTGCP